MDERRMRNAKDEVDYQRADSDGGEAKISLGNFLWSCCHVGPIAPWEPASPMRSTLKPNAIPAARG